MKSRPGRITALSIFFAAGAVISFTSAISLLFPNNFLQPLWKFNPRALDAFHHMGFWAIVLMFVVSIFCGLAAYGLWNAKLWGYYIAIGMLIINLIGDIYNFGSGIERRAFIGIPIVILILFFIMKPQIRMYFQK
jgi:uncharacterized membrane protein (DUF2068 family)